MSSDRAYGYHVDEIHPFFRKKRAWSMVKDKIVADYIACYLKTVQHRGSPIIIVDAFAGPGQFGDGSKGSPLLICDAISAASRHVGIGCLFADAHPAHRTALAEALKEHIRNIVAAPPLEDFPAVLSRALEIGTDSTVFFYLDPYGIKDLDFTTVRQIAKRDLKQSTEVLINFNFRTFRRMSGNWTDNDSASLVAQKVRTAKVETVNTVMGGDYWQAIITDPHLDTLQRENVVMAKYVEQLQHFFPYTYAIPVKEEPDPEDALPQDELAKYHLIFGTRNARAVVYMNDVGLNALTPYLKGFKDGLLFDVTPTRYQPVPAEEIKAAIVKVVEHQPLTRPEIYEHVIPQFFLERLKKEYRAIIDELAFAENRIFPDPKTTRRARKLNDETRLSATPWPT